MTDIAKKVRSSTALLPERNNDPANPWMFFSRWLANPLQMGSIVPSSQALCERVVRATKRGPDEAILELGGGTGVISRALRRATRVSHMSVELARVQYRKEPLQRVTQTSRREK